MAINSDSVDTVHPEYTKYIKAWERVRDCIEGEDTIKAATEKYLPRPEGMSGEYASAYDAYIERAHFPLVTAYALSGALGIIINKIPEFNVPKELEYIIQNATKDGKSLQQLFLDLVIQVFCTGKAPVLVDILKESKEFRFVPYTAFDFINWKNSRHGSTQDLLVAVFEEKVDSDPDNIFSHDQESSYRVFYIDDSGKYHVKTFLDSGEDISKDLVPSYMGKTLNTLPIFMCGSINNSFESQPIPLIAVANCAVQIYRKEADLANSEFLSCNPTLCITGANNDDLPNVVGSSVLMAIPNELARVFYTTTDTKALTHVKNHITDLYDEAIRHGVAILDARKGVEAAEALRIRQATQSASVYSIYLSCLNALKHGLKLMCKWSGLNEEEVIVDAPTALTEGVPDASVLKELITGFSTVIPLNVIYRYLVSSGLLDQTIGYEEYIQQLVETAKVKKQLNINDNGESDNVSNNSDSSNNSDISSDNNDTSDDNLKKPKPTKASVENEGTEDNFN